MTMTGGASHQKHAIRGGKRASAQKGKKTPPETGKPRHQRRKWIAVVSIAAFIILSLVALFIILSKLKLVLSDELILHISPNNPSYATVNGEPVDVRFTIRNENFRNCKAACTFTLTDLAGDAVVSASNETLDHDATIAKDFTLEPGRYGRGQRIYLFQASCRNLKSNICLTDGKPRMQSSAVFVDYELKEEDSLARDETKHLLTRALDQKDNIMRILLQTKALIGLLPPNAKESNASIQTTAAFDKKARAFIAHIDNLTAYWNDERYQDVAANLDPTDIATGDAIIAEGRTNQEKTGATLDVWKENVAYLEEIIALRPTLKKAITFYHDELNSDNAERLFWLDKAVKRAYTDYRALLTNNSVSLSAIRLDETAATLRSRTEEYAGIERQGIALQELGEVRIAIKNNKAIPPPSPLSCPILRDISQRLADENGRASQERENASNATLLHLMPAIDEIELLAQEKTARILNGSSAAQVMNATEEDYYAIANLTADDLSMFIAGTCGKKKNDTLPPFLALLDQINLSLRSTTLNPPNVTVNSSPSLDEKPVQCCVFATCTPCCDKCDVPPPTIFIHGHTVSDTNTPEFMMNVFAKMQAKMMDAGFIDLGELNISLEMNETNPGEWGRSRKPVTVRSTYYYIATRHLGSYTVTMQKSERIENYAIRLKEIVDQVKQETGAQKVNIVAHSMGGLVARDYMALFGDADVNVLIAVNTPHHGITPRIYKACALLGNVKECEDMSAGSIFLSRLPAPAHPEKVYAIRSGGCLMDGVDGDGIVTTESAYLEGATNYLIKGKCTDKLKSNLHSQVLDPDLYPQTTELITMIIKKNS